MKFDWDDYMQALHIYMNEHGDCVVPQGYKVEMTGMNLGKWVQNQRQNKRNNKLPKEREDELNAVDFRWSCGTTTAPVATGKKKTPTKKKVVAKQTRKRKKANDDDEDDNEPISKLKAKKSRAKSPAKTKGPKPKGPKPKVPKPKGPPPKKRRTTKAKTAAPAGDTSAAMFERAVGEIMDIPSEVGPDTIEGNEKKNDMNDLVAI
jgi:Helicase associated domain